MNKEISRLLQGVQSAITALSRYNDVENEASARKAMYDLGNYLDEFFSKNVVIPKGQLRHPYADVLHEMAERPDNIEYLNPYDVWQDIDVSVEYRIKPQEPTNIQSYDDRISTETWFKASDYCKENNLCPFDSASWSKAVKAVSKPQEPVYEWQWLYYLDGEWHLHPTYYTDEDTCRNYTTNNATNFIRIEETKRERK